VAQRARERGDAARAHDAHLAMAVGPQPHDEAGKARL
jgi:hypothetical protein